MNGFARGVALAGLLGLAGILSPVVAGPQTRTRLSVTWQQQQQQQQRIRVTRIRKVEYRLHLVVAEDRRGLEVVYVAPHSPATRMIGLRSGTRGSLEEGDVITHIDGRRVYDLDDLRTALRLCDGELVLTVRDVRSGALRRWLVRPHKVLTTDFVKAE